MDLIPANASQPLTDALRKFSKAAEGAFSGATAKAYRQAWARFDQWCDTEGRDALPATAASVAEFVDCLSATRSPATVRLTVAGVAFAHRAAGLPDPTAQEIVRLALKRMTRAKGVRQRQAKPMTFDIRNRLLEAGGSRLIDIRNRAILAFGYDTGCRRSEIVAVALEDIEAARDGSGTVLVRRSKTDQAGRGSVRYLAPGTMARIAEWVSGAGIQSGYLFRAVNRGGSVGGPLARCGSDTGRDVARIFKAMAKIAGLKSEVVAGLSGHSCRVGLAQDMAAQGIDLSAIMQSCGWKTPAMAARYCERLTAKRSGAAKLAALQDRA